MKIQCPNCGTELGAQAIAQLIVTVADKIRELLETATKERVQQQHRLREIEEFSNNIRHENKLLRDEFAAERKKDRKDNK